jgi:hypothetical protein
MFDELKSFDEILESIRKDDFTYLRRECYDTFDCETLICEICQLSDYLKEQYGN